MKGNELAFMGHLFVMKELGKYCRFEIRMLIWSRIELMFEVWLMLSGNTEHFCA